MSYSPVRKDVLCLWVFINTVNKDNGYKGKARKYGEKKNLFKYLWGKTFLVESTANVKALRQKNAQCTDILSRNRDILSRNRELFYLFQLFD